MTVADVVLHIIEENHNDLASLDGCTSRTLRYHLQGRIEARFKVLSWISDSNEAEARSSHGT